MNSQTDLTRWLEAARERGHAPLLLTLLDVIKPVAPVLANGLLVAQPFLPFARHERAMLELADLLEAPDGIERLRQKLAEDAMEVAQ